MLLLSVLASEDIMLPYLLMLLVWFLQGTRQYSA